MRFQLSKVKKNDEHTSNEENWHIPSYETDIAQEGAGEEFVLDWPEEAEGEETYPDIELEMQEGGRHQAPQMSSAHTNATQMSIEDDVTFIEESVEQEQLLRNISVQALKSEVSSDEQIRISPSKEKKGESNSVTSAAKSFIGRFTLTSGGKEPQREREDNQKRSSGDKSIAEKSTAPQSKTSVAYTSTHYTNTQAEPNLKVISLQETSSVAEKEVKRRFGSHVRSALGPGTVVEGKFSFDEPVQIDGSLTGEVTSTSLLIVGEEATVNATIKVGSLIVFGTVNGPVKAEELIEIKAGGKLEGNIFTERFVIEDGGWFAGRCNR